ncbi:MAG: thiamine pyrophosphate-dependent dehydrogenase E1 component subunit alpha [Polyangiales bacterium]
MSIELSTPAPERPHERPSTVPLQMLRPDGQLTPGTCLPLEVTALVSIYQAMWRTRHIDQRLERLQRQGRIGFHVGSLGEEAAIVAAAAALTEQDWILPCYREFGALLWRGFALQALIHNAYGNAADTVHGRQMPDHVTSKALRFLSVSSPVGTQMTQAVGLGWAAKLSRDPAVAAVFFGDGATSCHDFHASLNFAAVMQAPVVFLCRNNGWAISTPLHQQSANPNLAERGESYGMAAARVDGNDAVATYAAVARAAKRAREGGGPTFIELLTYRLGGHSTSDDPRAYRSDKEVGQAEHRCPLRRLRRYLEGQDLWDDEKEEAWRASVHAELQEAIAAAEAAGPPPLDTLTQDVYAAEPPHLQRQRTALLQGPRPTAAHAAPAKPGDKGGACPK